MLRLENVKVRLKDAVRYQLFKEYYNEEVKGTKAVERIEGVEIVIRGRGAEGGKETKESEALNFMMKAMAWCPS